MQGSAGVTLQRGHCCLCGQNWVLGKIDSNKGEYGQFYCAACWDRNADNQTDATGNIVETKSAGRRTRRQRRRHEHAPSAEDLRLWAREFLQLPRVEDDSSIEVRDIRVGRGEHERVLHMVTDNLNEHFRSCGASVWLGSQVLLAFMEEELGRHRHGSVRIAELGAGCGLPGMGLAQLPFCEVDVVLTDVPSQCGLLECNVALNFFKNGIAHSWKTIPRVMPLPWDSRSHLEAFLSNEEAYPGFDYIIGSEIAYDETSLPRLLRTLRALAALPPPQNGSRSRIILAVGERPGEFETFRRQAARYRWRLEILAKVDLEAAIGDPMCSPVLIIELFNMESQRNDIVSMRREADRFQVRGPAASQSDEESEVSTGANEGRQQQLEEAHATDGRRAEDLQVRVDTRFTVRRHRQLMRGPMRQ
eukprot:TRINITY_DN12427_c0_g1_i1.p1 TRINITY_DN12427_c0_g1~~TRINITY_DN12427_c0_g1_i1.p1  ORF type:complete len:418 (-),score=50.73 TRINITY_DN12427_c0_g1_i1:430-1683(-)